MMIKHPRTSTSATSFKPTAATTTTSTTAAATTVIDLYHNDDNNNDENDGATHAIINTTRNSRRRRRQRCHPKRVHNSDARMDSVATRVRSKTKIQPQPPVVVTTVIDLCGSPTPNNIVRATTATAAAVAVAPMVYHLDLGDDDDRKPAASLRKHPNTTSDNDPWNDYKVALKLQQEEERTLQWRDVQNQANDERMTESPTDKAWKFVERVLVMVERLRVAAAASTTATDFAMVTPIATDNLVFLTERTLVEQADFFYRGKPTVVDLGYHYTRTSNLTGIRDDGLLSRVERSEKQIVATKENGAVYGEGIYTAKDPSAFASYGDIGLLVARLQGHNADHTFGAGAVNNLDSWTVHRNVVDEFTVLSSAPLCIPILQFPSMLLAKGKLVLEMYQKELLGIVNEFFNQNTSTNRSNNKDLAAAAAVTTIELAGHATPMHAQYAARAVMPAPSSHWLKQNHRHLPLIGGGMFSIPVQPIVSATAIVNETIQYAAPETMGMSNEGDLWNACQSNDVKPNSICTICLDPMLEQCRTNTAAVVVALHKCGHQFHLGCIQQALGHGPSCPSCRRPLKNPQGAMPSGTMTVQHQTSIVCAGFEPAGSIVIQYSIPSSTQKLYHPHPGVTHGCAHWVTYIPHVPAGLDLLKRLKFAFQHGLTFTVGVSMTSGQDNSVTWASIHHKTSCYGGCYCHGFPDPGFFVNCNKEMDALFVPGADHL